MLNLVEDTKSCRKAQLAFGWNLNLNNKKVSNFSFWNTFCFSKTDTFDISLDPSLQRKSREGGEVMIDFFAKERKGFGGGEGGGGGGG